jgi:hypothetical protein
MDAVNTIDPPLEIIGGIACSAQMTNPRVLTRMTSSNTSSGRSTTPPGRYASAALVKFR